MNRKNIIFLLLKFCFCFRNINVLALEDEGIVGGTVSHLVNPYHVSIQEKGDHICGGGVLSENHIVTAAHCVLKSDNRRIRGALKVVGGTDDLYADSSTRQIRDVDTAYIPRQFFNDLKYEMTGDIAILKLKTAFILLNNPHIRPLKLPSPKNIFDNKVAIIAGFGFNEMRVFENQNTKEIVRIGNTDGKLRSATAKVLSQDECSYSKGYRVAFARVCAHIQRANDSEVKGACDGDSGSPLVVGNNPGTTLVGVMSVGLSHCDESMGPSIYTRVTSFLKFIDTAIKDGIDPKIRKIKLPNS